MREYVIYLVTIYIILRENYHFICDLCSDIQQLVNLVEGFKWIHTLIVGWALRFFQLDNTKKEKELALL